MTIGPGTTLGPYEILSLLGEGGMGSVWKARDPRLGRYVAIKVARAQFTERFEREARAVAALNHPNICTLYDVGPNYLVMEYIEGPTLAGRIKQGAFSLEEALPILRLMADAIEAAHDKNITHRDLKPDNIKITPEGVVKVLDFGLAKAADPLPRSDDPANATTLRLATVVGAIMGTPEYMAPEQASGEVADKRADIWAFGVVALEMFTARKLFDGATIVLTMAEVLTKEFTVDAAPAAMQPLLRRCLVRDVKRRMRDIGEARIALEKIADGDVEAAPTVRARRKWLFPALAAFFATGMAVAAMYAWSVSRPTRQQFVRLETDLGVPVPRGSGVFSLAVSADGARVVFVGRTTGGANRLFSRRLDQATTTEMPGTDGAAYPFLSPDGRWVGFFAGGLLKKVAVDGGAPITLCDAVGGFGASWGEDGNIVASLGVSQGLSLVPASGGKPTMLTERGPAEHTHRFPSVLPGGKGVLFLSAASSEYANANVEVYSFKNRKRKVLAYGIYPRYLGSGHLAYVKSGTLFAVPFHLDSLEVRGTPFPILEDVTFFNNRGYAVYDLSRTGTLVYYRSSGMENEFAVQWLDASGRATPVPSTDGARIMRLSPDGKLLAYRSFEGSTSNLLVNDLERGTKTKVTFDQEPASFVWNAGSRAVLFTVANKAFWARSDGASKPQQILEDKDSLMMHDISPDGQTVSLRKIGELNVIYLAKLQYKDSPSPDSVPSAGKLEKSFDEGRPVFGTRFSPDGKWLAYHTVESPASQVYVRSFPDSGAKWQVSGAAGGFTPVWSPNGRELFYKHPAGRIMAVDYVIRKGVFTPGTPRFWTEHHLPGESVVAAMSIAPDGKRMVVLAASQGQALNASPQATVLVNFFEEVRRRAQASGQ